MDTLTYILKILEVEDTSPLILALNQESILDINNLFTISEQYIIYDLQYIAKLDGKPTIVPKFWYAHITCLF